MSEICLYKSSVRIICQDLLKLALDYLVQQNQGQIVSAVQKYGGQEYSEWQGKPVITAIKTKDVPRGIGLIAGGDGALQFIGDDYGNEKNFEGLMRLIELTYYKTACLILIKNKGYQPGGFKITGNYHVIDGVKE